MHIPFCQKKCPYCDFNTYAKLDELRQPFVDALCLELKTWGDWMHQQLHRRTLDTIFLGGGTPTVLSAGQLGQIVEAINDSFDVASHCEFTSEANPGAVDRAKFGALVELGVNRLSMGVQSFEAGELQFLGRIHDTEDVLTAYDVAREAGFQNINLDFIFGLPNQEEEVWRSTLVQALALAPEHLSLYSLIVEPQTPLYQWVETGRVDAPDDDQAGLLYEIAMNVMAEAGYVHYEVSNWAKHSERPEQPSPYPARSSECTATKSPASYFSTLTPSTASRHNLIYWRNQEFVGVGPGAHSFLWTENTPRILQSRLADPTVAGVRWGNRKPVRSYIDRVHSEQTAILDWDEIDRPTAMAETMMMGLRLLREGVRFEDFRQQHGADLRDVYGAELQHLYELNLLAVGDERIRLTPKGLMLGNQVFAAFLPS